MKDSYVIIIILSDSYEQIVNYQDLLEVLKAPNNATYKV